uniref:Hemicentin-1-like n=1 Tax=Erpetoichthys calabaricus TaxID=27687 RepID=A0A8C4SFM3_ERPCA
MNSIVMVSPEMTISGEPRLVSGQSATFNCSVSGFYPPDINVSWVINDKSMMHEGANAKQNDDGTFTESKTITLTATEEYHHHQLICQASHGGFKKVPKSVTLSVRAHPTITGQPHKVEPGRSLTLICDSKGDKNTTITWLKDGAHIVEGHTETWENGSRNNLVMKIEKKDLESQISCQIPGYGRDKVLSAHLNISNFLIVHPNVTIHENPKLILGQVANFTCWIQEFYPRNISVLWSNGSTSMKSSNEVMENKDGTFTARSCITFNVTEEHRGNHLKCQATFQGSEPAESTITLGVRAQPVITGHLQRIKEGDNVTLSCTSKGDTDTDVTWLKDGSPQVRGRSEVWPDGSNSSFTWTFGKPDITSNVSCLVPGYERDKMSHTVNISDYIIVLPNLAIKKQVLRQNNQITRVTCFVEQFYPQNINMELLWEGPSEKFHRNETHENTDGTFSTSASLEIEVGEAAVPVSCWTHYQGMNLSSLTINVTDERQHEKMTHMMTSFIILAAVLICILALAGLVARHFIRRAHRKSTSGNNSGPTGFTDTQKTSLETYVTYAELDVSNFENRKKANNNENFTEYAEIRLNAVQREEDENDEVNYANLDSLNRNWREEPMASATQQSEHPDYAVVHFHRRTQAKS